VRDQSILREPAYNPPVPTTSEPIWVTPALLTDAAMYAGLAVLLAVLSLAAPPPRRRGLAVLAAMAVLMLGGLWLLFEFGPRLGIGTPYDIAREALLALLAVAVIRSAVLFVAHIVLGRFRVPHILVDALFMLGLIAYAIYRLNAVGLNLAGIVTTSAIVTGALAFSAGETLSNLWAGVSLQIENTLRIGDWVRFDDKIGQVVSIRWRSMAIATPANETFVVPNSALMKDRIVVLGRAGEAPAPWRRQLTFQVDYEFAPARVVQVITDALRRCEIPNVTQDPPPLCMCAEFQDSGILYRAIFFLKQIDKIGETDSAVLVTIYAALQRENMPIPFPQQVVEIKRRSGTAEASAELDLRTKVLGALELFGVLTQAERDTVAAGLHKLPYASNDIVFRKGESADSLCILARGHVRIMDEDARGRRMPLAELAAPDYFGEMGLLTGQPRRATIIATDDVLCYGLDKAAFDAVLKARPEIAEALGHVLARRQADTDATLKAAGADAKSRGAMGGAMEIVHRIRQFFGLPG